MVLDKRLAQLYPTMIVTALNIGVFSNTFVTMMTQTMKGQDIKKDDREPDALLCMIGLGVGEIGGSIAFGKVTDMDSHSKKILINVIAPSIACVMLILYTAIYKFTFYFSIIMTLTWGVQDAGINCLLNSLLGFQFVSKTTPFAVFKFLQSLFIFIVAMVCTQIKT